MGGQIKDVKDSFGDQIHEIKENFKDVKTDITGLMRRQTEIEVVNITRVEELDMGCGKAK